MPSRSFAIRIYFIALILRLIPVFLARGLGIGLDDMFQYDMLARSLVAGNGYRWYAQADLEQLAAYVDFDLNSVKAYDPIHGIATSHRPPLYPAFLAVVYFFSGTGASRFFAARLAQAIFLGAPLAPLTYLVSNKLFRPLLSGRTAPLEAMRSERASRLAAWTIAVYPMLLLYPLGLATENLFLVLLLASFYFLLQAIENIPPSKLLSAPSRGLFADTIPLQSNIYPPILAGLLLGLTALTRSVVLPFVAIAFLVLFYAARPRSLLLLFSFLLVVIPWIVRNSFLHGRLSGIETSSGIALYVSYHPQGNGSFIFGPSMDLLPILDDSVRDQVGKEKAMEFIRANPERLVPLAINRLGFFFGLEKRALMYFYSNNVIGFVPLPLLLTIAVVLLIPFVVVSISAALSLPLLRWNVRVALLASLFAAYLLPHILVIAEDRFHLALVPFLAILAAQFWTRGFSSFATRWRESNTGRIIVLFSMLVVFLLIANWGFELARDADKIALLLSPNGNEAHFPY